MCIIYLLVTHNDFSHEDKMYATHLDILIYLDYVKTCILYTHKCE